MSADLETITRDDLEAASERLYYAANRLTKVFDQAFIAESAAIHGARIRINVGTVAHDVVEAARRYDEAHTRWAETQPPCPGCGQSSARHDGSDCDYEFDICRGTDLDGEA